MKPLDPLSEQLRTAHRMSSKGHDVLVFYTPDGERHRKKTHMSPFAIIAALEEDQQFRQDAAMAAATCKELKPVWEQEQHQRIDAMTDPGRPVMVGNYTKSAQLQIHNE